MTRGERLMAISAAVNLLDNVEVSRRIEDKEIQELISKKPVPARLASAVVEIFNENQAIRAEQLGITPIFMLQMSDFRNCT